MKMNKIILIAISLILASCGASQEDKNIAAVTCSIMGETRNMDAAVRVREMNNAREKIGGEPFLQGDDAIKEAFEYGLCQELVLNENYEEMIIKAVSEPSIIELFHENGQLKSKTNFKGGEYHGLSESYYENGQLESKYNYKDGELDGLSEGYYENGQLKRKEYWKDGEPDGLSVGYYENGQLQDYVKYKDGKPDGPTERYYENGQLASKEYWKDGELDGLSEAYWEDGQLSTKSCYKDGEWTDDSYCKPQ